MFEFVVWDFFTLAPYTSVARERRESLASLKEQQNAFEKLFWVELAEWRGSGES
jgi:hypothetical protein